MPTSSDVQQVGGNSSTAEGSDVSQNSQNSQNNDNSSSQNSDNTANNTAGSNGEGTGNTGNLNSPLLPSQPLYSSPLYSSPVGNGGESTQLNAPALYNTGVFDLSQISASNSLAQAFMLSGTVASEQSPDQGPSPLDRIRIGPVDLKTALNFTVVSDDNINAQPDGPNRLRDDVFTLVPALLVVYGVHEGQKGYASIVYAPTLTRYAHYSAQDSDDQNVALNLQYPFQRLSLNASGTYAQTTGVNLDARTNTTQTTEMANVGGNYEIDDKFSVQSGVQYVETTYSGVGSGAGTTNNSSNGLVDDTRESWGSSLAYHLTDKLNFGPGFTIGVESPQGSPQQTFEQGLVNVSYQPTEKISFFAQGGVEWRHYSGGTDQTNPVFSGGVSYSPTESATLSLSGYQNVEPTSDDSNQTDVNTGVAISASERLFQRVVLGFSFIYAHTEYKGNGGTTAAPATATTTVGPYTINANGSSQDNIVYRPSLSVDVNQWSSVALYYQYQGNTSSVQGSSYYDNSLGVSLSAQF